MGDGRRGRLIRASDRKQAVELISEAIDSVLYKACAELGISKRTAEAGIPIMKQQGVNGGVVLDEKYAVNRSKLTASEEADLMIALDEIKKLPNAQLEYALKLMKQYFNEAATLWVNTDNISLDTQEKFHQVKRATIEKRIIEFKYFIDGEFLRYRVEPYELRLADDIWKVLVRNISEKSFEEIYLSRIAELKINSMCFKRIEIPDEFGKKYTGPVEKCSFEIILLSDELLNRFPIENFKFDNGKAALNIKVKSDIESERIYRYLKEIGGVE